MDQENFLATVRASLRQGARGEPALRPERYRPPAPPSGEEMVERLTRELQAVGGTVHRAGSAAAARQAILEILRQRGVGSVVRGDTDLMRWLDLDGDLEAAGIEVTVCRLGDGTTAERLRAAAFDADAGISSIDLGVAETGTLAILARPGQGRSVSLLPPLHVAVLDARDVVQELSALFAKAAEGREEPPSAFTLITGPSRTGDIELVLTIGVHGPGELHLVVIER